jgi:hypothetical protein
MKISSVLYTLLLLATAVHASYGGDRKSSEVFLRQTIPDSQQYHRVEIQTVVSSLTDVLSKILSAILNLFKLQRGSNVFNNNNDSGESILNSSDMPSLAPSDMPSYAPSDMPSLAPSDMPSDHPSISSPEWEDNNPGDDPFPDDFDVCANSGSTAEEDRADLTVLYGYKLELASGGKVFEATRNIELKMHESIQTEICTESDVLAISADPLDIPGALCNGGDQTAANGPCFFIAGRMRLFIKQENILNSAGVYCMVLEAARNYMATVNATAEFQDVVNIESTIIGSLVPTFCNFLSQADSSDPDSSNAAVTDSSASDITPATKSSESNASNPYVMPAAVSGASCFVVMVALLLIRRRRKLTSSELNIDSSSTSSVLQIDTMGDGVSPRTDSIYINSVLSRISIDTDRDL